jgi:MoaA/NifB/PqqE/SkfB family radical SAM enzyme
MIIKESQPQPQPNRPGDDSAPVERPKRGAWTLFKEVMRHGGPGYLQFAITNICNADCGFCGFARSQFDPKARRSVTLEEARGVVDVAVKNRIGYLLFVGGEPMAHRDLRPMTRYAAERGLRPMICTNGGLWTAENMRGLVNDGLSSVIMSIDTHDIAGHEKNRGLPGVCQKIKKANEFFHGAGVQTTASITASRLIEDYAKLPAFLKSLGFNNCTFSYPLTSLASSYLSFSDSGLVNYTREELIELFEKIKTMKQQSGFPVVNPRESLDEMQRHLRGEPEKFGCLGGYKYFYLDWKLDLYRCHFWETPMCKVWDWDERKLIRDGCTRCMIDCYRDPSVLQFIGVNASDAWQAAKQGNLAGAARHVFDARNLTSLKAVWEDWKWIGKV